MYVYGTHIIYIPDSGQAKAIPGITIFRSSAMIYYANAELYQEALLKKVPHTTDELHTGSKTKNKSSATFFLSFQSGINVPKLLKLKKRKEEEEKAKKKQVKEQDKQVREKCCNEDYWRRNQSKNHKHIHYNHYTLTLPLRKLVTL